MGKLIVSLPRSTIVAACSLITLKRLSWTSGKRKQTKRNRKVKVTNSHISEK